MSPDCMQVAVALEDVRSAHNVGSVFRTADAAGAQRVHLIGTTPAPIDRFGRAQPEIAKTALGAEHALPWVQHETSAAFLTRVQRDGARLVAVEQDSRAVVYTTLPRVCAGASSVVLLFGNEVTGVSPEVRAAADAIVAIPMHGEKESLNVSVAAGIILYRLRDDH